MAAWARPTRALARAHNAGDARVPMTNTFAEEADFQLSVAEASAETASDIASTVLPFMF